jgi:hypothetical protein
MSIRPINCRPWGWPWCCSVLALALLGRSPVLAQETVTFSRDDARVVAEEAALNGDPELALRLAEGLLLADPQDRAAFIIVTLARLTGGQPDLALSAARQAFAFSTTEIQRYEAARLVAFAAMRAERLGLSQFWLRRAGLYAPDAAALEQTAADYAQVRAVNPLSVRLSFSLAPSQNINGGAESPVNIVDGFPVVGQLSADAQALTGWAATYDAGLSWRLAETDVSRTSLSLSLSGRQVWLTDGAQAFLDADRDADDPRMTGQDFSTAELTLSGEYLRLLPGGIGSVDLALTRRLSGRDWQSDVALTGLRRWDIGEGQTFDLRLGRTWRMYDTGQPVDRRDRLDFTLSLAQPQNNSLTLGLGLSQTDAPGANTANIGWQANAGYSLGPMVGPFQLSGSVGYQFTDYADYRVIFPVPGGRQDERWSASLTAALPGQAVAGFMPVITLGWEDIDSNVSRFSRDGLSVDLSLRSTF